MGGVVLYVDFRVYFFSCWYGRFGVKDRGGKIDSRDNCVWRILGELLRMGREERKKGSKGGREGRYKEEKKEGRFLV